jgi:hemerythrin-like domain-containing protein
MKPRGMLMIEHRLIEKMLSVIEREIGDIRRKGEVDPVFIDTAVDFIRTYADRTHHGKEEDILFKELENKKMDENNSKIMTDLVDEHKRARKTVTELVAAKSRYVGGDGLAVDDVIRGLTWLIEFYPVHIKKEDEIFFPATEKYFSDNELEKLVASFREFDMGMIHEKYAKVVTELQGRYSL